MRWFVWLQWHQPSRGRPVRGPNGSHVKRLKQLEHEIKRVVNRVVKRATKEVKAGEFGERL